MAEPYLERLRAIVREAAFAGSSQIGLECKHFFSGAALYANGVICVSLTPAGLALKLPEETRTALIRERRGKPLRYFRGAPIKKEYVLLSRGAASESETVRALVRESIRYVAHD